MTSIKLYFAIGFASFVILLSIQESNSRPKPMIPGLEGLMIPKMMLLGAPMAAGALAMGAMARGDMGIGWLEETSELIRLLTRNLPSATRYRANEAAEKDKVKRNAAAESEAKGWVLVKVGTTTVALGKDDQSSKSVKGQEETSEPMSSEEITQKVSIPQKRKERSRNEIGDKNHVRTLEEIEKKFKIEVESQMDNMNLEIKKALDKEVKDKEVEDNAEKS